MGLIDLFNHLLNFVAPALALALVLPLGARLLGLKAGAAHGWRAQVAINFVVGVLVLLASLWWWGRDGKMATYAALVLAVATCQWVLAVGWKR